MNILKIKMFLCYLITCNTFTLFLWIRWKTPENHLYLMKKINYSNKFLPSWFWGEIFSLSLIYYSISWWPLGEIIYQNRNYGKNGKNKLSKSWLTLFFWTFQIVFLTFSEIKPQETIRVSFLNTSHH